MVTTSQLNEIPKAAKEVGPRLGGRLFKARLYEYLMNDSWVFKFFAGVIGLAAGLILFAVGRARKGFELLAKIHRANWFGWADAGANWLACRAVRKKPDNRLMKVYRQHLEDLTPIARNQLVFQNPERMLYGLVMVLKSPKTREKGVLAVLYNHGMLAFARLFDVDKIAGRYHIVLEPSWSGYCTLDILSYTQFGFPAFVQAYEPRDAAFVDGLVSNLITVPLSNNWWVDHRLFRPISGTSKDIDLVMAASWGDYKRHHRFFAALGKLRRSGHKPSVLLLGYPIDRTRDEIVEQARYYGVEDQLEVHEKVPYHQVNDYLNRAKVNILWSRKEGVNRAIIEGMLAGIPCIVHEGLNYGYRYPYINQQTGCFSSERDLPTKLLWMIEHHEEFSPRQWAMEQMSCQRSTEILADRIRDHTLEAGESWTEGLAVKVNQLSGMVYWEPQDRHKFAEDYEFLRSAVRK